MVSTREQLEAWATVLTQVREFFKARAVLEVQTPLLMREGVTAPHLHQFIVSSFEHSEQAGFLQTSPEYAMKALLANGSGSIFQICKAFRAHESGRLHHPEFMMLEWYRVGFGLTQLMNEVTELIQEVLGTCRVECISYREAFLDHLSVDPFDASDAQLTKCIQTYIEGAPSLSQDRNAQLELLFSHAIQPKLGDGSLCFVTDFPLTQAALAKRSLHDPQCAARFECFVDGVELANGYDELNDPTELLARFAADNQQRLDLGIPEAPLPNRLLDAMKSGLPACAGVALGLDRLLMLKMGWPAIKGLC